MEMPVVQSLIPLSFALLWSTGFIGAKFGLADVSPLFFLFLRMMGVLPIFIILCIFFSHGSISTKDRIRQLIVGIFVHGFFLGGAFSAMGGGVSAGVVSFITSLNPLLVLVLSILIWKTPLSRNQIKGFLLAVAGLFFLLLLGNPRTLSLSMEGVGYALFALVGISIGTMLQKRWGGKNDMLQETCWQYMGATLFFSIVAFTLETPTVVWSVSMLASLLWLVLVLSTGAILLLMTMIRKSEIATALSYFYLVPLFTAVQGWLFFDEPWTLSMLFGAVLILIGLRVSMQQK